MRVCKVCKQELDYEKPDPCLGYLPGVKFACCGHGEKDGGYIKFENGVAIYFDTEYITDWDTYIGDKDAEGYRPSDCDHFVNFRTKD